MIIVYDIDVERVNKVCQFLRRHLNWIQNSVFEGELSRAHFEEVKTGLKEIIDKDVDSVLVFTVLQKKLLRKEVIGVEKMPVSQFI